MHHKGVNPVLLRIADYDRHQVGDRDLRFARLRTEQGEENREDRDHDHEVDKTVAQPARVHLHGLGFPTGSLELYGHCMSNR